MPKIGMLPIRRQQLIDATIICIDRKGIANTTIKDISKEADLSAGIISHYFDGKMGLLRETMLEMMRSLRKNISEQNKVEGNPTPKRAIEIIIECNFDESTDERAMKVWLSFWAMSMHQDDLNRLQKINDNRLYSNFLAQYKKMMPTEQAQNAAKGLAALIDGLWLHGSLRQTGFDIENAKQIALDFFHQSIKYSRKT